MLPSIEPSDVGHTGLIWLFVSYGYVLFRASNLISEGSELLLLVPSLAGLVGGVVLPLLGAVPDGAIMLFSGMGDIEKAQESLSVGIGALAGSTIMLLTIPWGLSVLAGRVNIVDSDDGKKTANYSKAQRKLEAKPLVDQVSETGVSITQMIQNGANIMIFTTIPYFLIQGPAFFLHGGSEQIASGEKNWALLGFLVCVFGFVYYLLIQLKASKADEEKFHRMQVIADLLKKGKVSLSGAFYNIIDTFDTDAAGESGRLLDCPSGKVKEYLSSVLEIPFNKYDKNKNKKLEYSEVKIFLNDFHEKLNNEDSEHLFQKYDSDGDGTVSFDEFVQCCYDLIKKAHGAGDATGSYRDTMERELIENVNESEDEEEEVPIELADLPPNEQQKAIKKMAFSMLALGTALVLLFADPMVDVMQEIAYRVNISPFYVSFVLAPLASNASEVIASQYYAAKKTTKTITVSLSALLGAACMNNTFCLSIFMGLIYFRGLAWQYTAETIAIVLVQLLIYLMTRGDTMTSGSGLIIIAIFPLSIAFVAFLESFGID